MNILDIDFRKKLLSFLNYVKPLPDWDLRFDNWSSKKLNDEQINGRLKACLWSNKNEDLIEDHVSYYRIILKAIMLYTASHHLSNKPFVILDCDRSNLTLKEELNLMRYRESAESLLNLMHKDYVLKKISEVDKNDGTIIDLAWIYCSEDELIKLLKTEYIHIPLYGIESIVIKDVPIYKRILDLVT